MSPSSRTDSAMGIQRGIGGKWEEMKKGRGETEDLHCGHIGVGRLQVPLCH